MVGVIQHQDAEVPAAIGRQVLVQLLVLLREFPPDAGGNLIMVSGHHPGAVPVAVHDGLSQHGLATAWQAAQDEERLAFVQCGHRLLVLQEGELQLRLVLGS